MTLNCVGTETTPVVETELSSRAKEASKKRLSCGRDRGAASYGGGTPSWDHGLGRTPTLTCDGDVEQTSLQSYWSMKIIFRQPQLLSCLRESTHPGHWVTPSPWPHTVLFILLITVPLYDSWSKSSFHFVPFPHHT